MMDLSQYTTVFIPLDEIWSDDEFNCRGSIEPSQVKTLCESIIKNGLQTEIVVQPIEDVKGSAPPAGKKYRIVAGHRRFMAFRILRGQDETKYGQIPAKVRTGLDDIQVRILNLSENFDREDLDILQEAKALEKLHEAGIPRDHVAREIGKSSGWVQVRYNLLELPEDIQLEAKVGTFNQYQIKQLYGIRKDSEKLYEAVRTIKNSKGRGEKGTFVGNRKAEKTDVKKHRKPVEINAMIDVVQKAIGYGLETRMLAWAAGNVSTDELFEDVREYCKKYDLGEPTFPKEL